MTYLRYSVALIGKKWFVIYGRRWDPDLTDAFRLAVDKRARSTQRKIALFFQRYLNFRFFEGEPHDALVDERFEIARERFEGFLEAYGYEITESDREDEAMLVKLGDAGSMSALSCCIKAIGRIYRRLAVLKLRPRANPIKIDKWHLMTPEMRREIKEEICGSKDHSKYSGSYYVVSDAPTYAIRMEDALGLGLRVLAAGRAFGWPASIYDQVTVIDDDGARWVDTFDLSAADWARASAFGRTLWAPNKGSNGERVKKIMVRLDTVAQLKRSFDDDPNRPNFEVIEKLFAARDWKALENIYLFPSARGLPFAYHTFNNEYFRRAMEAGEVTVRSEANIARVTVHRLRAARIQEEADHIYRPDRTDKEIEVDEDALREDVSIKSKTAFRRYVGPLKEKRGETMKAVRSDNRQARRSGLDVREDQELVGLTATEIRLKGLS